MGIDSGKQVTSIIAFATYRLTLISFLVVQFPVVNDAAIPNVLKFKVAETMGRFECRRRMGQSAIYVHDNTICAASHDGFGACTGDTGGPLTNDEGVVVGVTSWSITCGTNHPDVYARVFPHLGFILGTTGIRM